MDGAIIVGLVATLLKVIAYLLVARALVSWFPDLRRHQIVQLLFDITDLIIEPLRRVIPRVGMLDLRVMIAVFGLFWLAAALEKAV
jgi:YggT family protein